VKVVDAEHGEAPADVPKSGAGPAAAADAPSNGAGSAAADTQDPSDAPCSPDLVVPFRAVGFKLSSLGYAVSRLFRQTLAPLGLEPREFAILRVVGAAEGLSQQAAGERLQIPASRMVAFVDALEAGMLLERRHNPRDRRTRTLYLTEEGRELLNRAFVLAAELERHLCAQLGDAERQQLLDLLERVGAQLGLAPGTHAAHVHAALADA
jgi:DNA-binding MarR family transcriptional regulator